MSEQEIIDEFMTDFVNSYTTATVWGQQGVHIQLDPMVRRKVTEFYRKHINKEEVEDGNQWVYIEKNNIPGEKRLDLLNKMGIQGWELCLVRGGNNYIFKRMRTSETEI